MFTHKVVYNVNL